MSRLRYSSKLCEGNILCSVFQLLHKVRYEYPYSPLKMSPQGGTPSSSICVCPSVHTEIYWKTLLHQHPKGIFILFYKPRMNGPEEPSLLAFSRKMLPRLQTDFASLQLFFMTYDTILYLWLFLAQLFLRQKGSWGGSQETRLFTISLSSDECLR